MNNFELEIKGVEEDGTFTGYASTYGNTDRVGDVIAKGAFADAHGTDVPVLWAHTQEQPEGLGRLEETDEGVRITGKLNLDTTAGREAYANLKRGIVKSLSVGFELLKHAMDGAVRVIKQGRIREVSLVVFPANPQAVVTAVKEEQPPCAARELVQYLEAQ
jgi:HK97 family phage prohead protease